MIMMSYYYDNDEYRFIITIFLFCFHNNIGGLSDNLWIVFAPDEVNNLMTS